MDIMRVVLFSIIFLAFASVSSAFPGGGIAALQAEVSGLPVGERIARWAEEFVGTPYDPDPDGEYVTRRVIVSDERVDCMYHTFRSVELAVSGTPEEAVAAALRMRFIEMGVERDGLVRNYDNRFRYAMDMLGSGKWGVEVTESLGPSVSIAGARGVARVVMVPKADVPVAARALMSGDIVFFVKNPSRRVVGEVIGHIGIVKREGEEVYLIHASGRKKVGGSVKKLRLIDYAASMPFVGIKVSRFGF